MRYLILVLPLMLIACSQSKPAPAPAPQVAQPAPKVQALDASHFQSMLKDHPTYILLDVRTPAEYSAGHLPGATLINFNSPDFDQKISHLDKTKTYLLYCRSGHRSSLAAAKLIALNIPCYHLAGGITAWQSAQLPITLR